MRIGITGTHGVGKTTLVNELEKYTDHQIIKEIARRYPRGINENPVTEINRQLDIFHAQMEEELNNNIGFVSDRTTIDNAAYMIYTLREYMNDLSLKDIVLVINNIYLAINNMSEYDVIFYIPIEFPCEDDGFRDTDEQYRQEIDFIIDTLLMEFRNTITGTVEERVKKVLEILNDN